VRQVIGAGLFDCWRNDLRFRIEITDSGEPGDMFRFMVHVMNPNGTRNSMACGNGGKTIREAIQGVHWTNLESDENCV
jgi:hypothetical protein